MSLTLSGERFSVVYHLTGTEAEARTKAADICLEQTVELPDDLVAQEDIRELIFGRVDELRPLQEGLFEAVISFAVEVAGFKSSAGTGSEVSRLRTTSGDVGLTPETAGLDLMQLLNVIFGNISLKPGIRVARLELPESVLSGFGGPRFGRDGLRVRLGVPERALLCTALKPMGLFPVELANLAYQFALGGIDIIKDDHGLADQSFCPFEERVERCVEAVARANRHTGGNCIYMPNVTAPADQVAARAQYAKYAGAGGLLIAPGLTGLDAVRTIADNDDIDLPIMSHPALQGSFVVSPHAGISHFALFGQLTRLAGADAVVFPNYGGRFSFSEEECRSLAEGTATTMGQIKPIFPTPAGGMSLARVPEMCAFYGREVIFLIGGGLHRAGPDLVENCQQFRRLVEKSHGTLCPIS